MPFRLVELGPSISPILPVRKGILASRPTHPTINIGGSRLSAHLVSVGILTWLTYGYAHLSIGAPFNAMFLIYLSVLTLAGFAMLDGLLRVDVAAASPAFAQIPRRAIAWFLAIAGAGIAALWLSEIVVGLPG